MKFNQCAYCKNKFQPKYSTQLFCGRRCYNLANTETLVGKIFGRLTVLEDASPKIKIERINRSKVKCTCGTEFITLNRALKCGHTTSCGCSLQKHGHCTNVHLIKASPTYVSYRAMLYRCHQRKSFGYANYGARGIKVCEKWRKSFIAFLRDLGERPIGMTLERLDVNGNYEPGNVIWATQKAQCNNKRPQHYWFAKLNEISVRAIRNEWSEKYPIYKANREIFKLCKEMARKYGVTDHTIRDVVAKRHWNKID